MALLAARALYAEDEAEDSFGHDDALHAILVVLGISAIAFTAHRRLPEAMGVLGTLSWGVWVSLLVHNGQVHGTPFGGTLPGDWSIPAIVGVVAALGAGLFVEFFWRAALTFLSAVLMSFSVLALCRLFNFPVDTFPADDFFDANTKLLSSYRVLGLVSLLAALLLCGCLMRSYDPELLIFSSVHLGTLLLLSGLSHFAGRLFFDQEPASLIDGLAQILTAAYEDGCGGGDGGQSSSGCDCDAKCKVEIVAWFLLSWLIILALELMRRHSKSAGGTEEQPAD